VLPRLALSGVFEFTRDNPNAVVAFAIAIQTYLEKRD
jgi:hypothetical protein